MEGTNSKGIGKTIAAWLIITSWTQCCDKKVESLCGEISKMITLKRRL